MARSLAESEWGGSGKKNDEEMDLDITPMIDVVFLLLIFFMVSSTMQATPDFDVPVAKHGKGLESKEAITFIIVGGSKEQIPEISLGKLTGLTLEQVTAEVATAVQNGASNVILMADKNIASGFLDDVSRAVNKGGEVKIAVGVQDKR